MSAVPIERIIKAAVDRGASDLHIKAGDLFRARIDGKLVPLTKQRLTPDQTKAIALKLLPSERARASLESMLDYDCSWGLPGVGRFQFSILRQRSSVMIVMRVIPFAVPSIEQLGLPDQVRSLADLNLGLVLVAGVVGSGKSSTIAAMLHHMNQSHRRHVVTVEDPIEFLHRDINCSITQREVGIDTETVRAGVRAALRQDPDVIVVGDVHDGDTLETALRATETGRLVIGAVHALDGPAAIGQAAAMVPPDLRDMTRNRLAECLTAVVSQQLVPRRDGAGRVAVVELLMATPQVREVIRGENLAALADLVAKGQRHGMQSFQVHAAELLKAGIIAPETAKSFGGRR
ncbi:MAG: PilT/PilU family type 4a pilus ATPase [Gemmatimonadetes bacterium]|nr:PilT/PilU family type 4a pilus ATPase [Gemmatimonadota bacterium]